MVSYIIRSDNSSDPIIYEFLGESSIEDNAKIKIYCSSLLR